MKIISLLQERYVQINSKDFFNIENKVNKILDFLKSKKEFSKSIFQLGNSKIITPSNKEIILPIEINLSIQKEIPINNFILSGDEYGKDGVVINLSINPKSIVFSNKKDLIKKRLIYSITHELSHIGRDISLSVKEKKGSKKRYFKDLEKTEKENDYSFYELNPLELDANISSMVNYYNNLGEEEKNISVEELMEKTGFRPHLIDLLNKNVKMQNKIMSRLHREGIILKKWFK